MSNVKVILPKRTLNQICQHNIHQAIAFLAAAWTAPGVVWTDELTAHLREVEKCLTRAEQAAHDMATLEVPNAG
jgi:hypothetical protein